MCRCPAQRYRPGVSARETILTVLIRPFDEQRVIDAVAQRFPGLPRIEFADAEGDPALREQWSREHPDSELGDRRCRELVVDTGGSSAQRLAEQVLDVISPHSRGEAMSTPPFPVTPDEFPWSAHTPLWTSGGAAVGENAANRPLETFYALAVFEVGTVDGTAVYFREDAYLIHAADLAEAQVRFDEIVRGQEYEARDGSDRSYVRLAHQIDLAPTPYDVRGDAATDLYSRHFASIDDYSRFEMKLGGRDPLADS